MIAVFWGAYARCLDKPLMLPTFVDTATTFWDELMRPLTFDSDGSLLVKAWTSVAVLLQGYALGVAIAAVMSRSEEHTSELQSLMRISYAVFCLKQKNYTTYLTHAIKNHN